MEEIAALATVGILGYLGFWIQAKYRKDIGNLCDVCEALCWRIERLENRIIVLEDKGSK